MRALQTGLVVAALWLMVGPVFARQEVPQQDFSGTAFFERFDETSQLQDGTARKIIQDRYGQMWIATQSGLVRYDGISFEQYRPRHSPDTPLTRNISDLVEAPNGDIWFSAGFGGGVARLDQSTQQFQTYRMPTVPESPDSGVVNSIRTIHVDPSGDLWVLGQRSERGSVTFRIDGETSEVTRVPVDSNDPSKLSGEIYDFVFGTALLNAADGSVWMGTDTGGLHRYFPDSGTMERLYFTEENTEEAVFSKFFQRKNGDIWASRTSSPLNESFVISQVCQLDINPFFMDCQDVKIGDAVQPSLAFVETHEGVLTMLAPGGYCTWQEDTQSLECNQVNDVGIRRWPSFPSAILDAAGNIWTNAMGGSEPVTVLNPSTGLAWPVRVSTGPNESRRATLIDHVMKDSKGTIWMGGWGSGLNRLDQERARFELLTDEPHSVPRLPSSRVGDLFQNTDGSIWIATLAGAIRYDSDLGITGRIGGARPIIRIIQRDNGSILYTRRDSVFSVTAALGEPRFVGRIEGIGNIASFHEDSRGVLWIGHANGLIKTDASLRNLTSIPVMATPRSAVSDSISQEEVWHITEDSKGYVWFGTDEGGLNRYDHDTGLFRSYYNPSVAVGGDPPLELPDGSFWYAGQSAVVRLDPESGEQVILEGGDGFPKPRNDAMIQDRNGDVWIPTINGLFRVDWQSLEATLFDKESGLPVTQFSDELAMTKDGSIWITSREGLVRFHPDRMQPDTHSPVVVIRSVVHGNPDSTDILLDRNAISFAHDDNDPNFHYFTADFDAPERIQYRYRMIGLEDEWVDVKGLTNARISNVPPGRYTFEVMASNADGLWSETPASISVRVRPPWWRTISAYLIYMAFAGLMVRQFVVWNTERVQRREREAQQARELEQARELATAHAELEASHTTLKATQAQLVEQEKLASLGSLTAGIAHEIKNPLNFVNNFAEVGAEMADELSEAIAAGRTEEAQSIIAELRENATQITKHGRRADDIVKAMMQHARGGASEMESVELNTFLEEYANLAWHGRRAKDDGFQAELIRDFSKDVGSLNAMPQELGRVILNLLNNAFDAVRETEGARVTIATRATEGGVSISVSDNGPGIPETIREKIFEPFFTTKPTGEGTGLGLSLSYDIITKGHGGTMTAGASAEGGAIFTLTLPDKS